MSLDFIASNLEIASKDFRGQVGAVVQQAVGLRKLATSMNRLVYALCFLAILAGVTSGPELSYGLTAVAGIVWLARFLVDIRYEQVYSQIHGECQVYHLRCIAMVSIVGALEKYGIELPAIFTDVDELIADILKEDS